MYWNITALAGKIVLKVINRNMRCIEMQEIV